MKMPQLPSANQFRAWKNSVFQALTLVLGDQTTRQSRGSWKLRSKERSRRMFVSLGSAFPRWIGNWPWLSKGTRLENWVVA